MSARNLPIGVAVLVTLSSWSCHLPGQDREIDVAFADTVAVGDLGRARTLLQDGADVNATFKSRGGMTTLTLLAAGSDARAIAEFLLQHGADPNVPDGCGRTPLMHAASRNHVETVALLLEMGADPTATDENGETALSLAKANHHMEAEDVLEDRITGRGDGG